jgi:RNA polymerase sigma factor (TIGR02999 family)
MGPFSRTDAEFAAQEGVGTSLLAMDLRKRRAPSTILQPATTTNDPMTMENITILLGEMRLGNSQARSELFTRVYEELTRLARARLPGGQHAHLDAPSLVHEAYLKLSEQEMPTLRDRREFFAYSAAVMRNVVVDLARRHNAQKRGSGMAHLTLSNVEAPGNTQPLDAEALHAALEHLERIDDRAYRVVEMRYFAGLSIEEIAEVLELSPMTIKRSWKSARAFLFKELHP